MKEILRCFRKRVKQVYLNMLHGENKSKWKPHVIRKKTRFFFTNPFEDYECLMISDEIYDKYEAIFFSFINNTVKYDDIENKFKITPDPFTEVMRDAFGGHPNKENLKKFFTHEVIQNLWWKQWEVSDKCKPI